MRQRPLLTKDIEILDRETPWSDELVEEQIESQRRRAESEKGKYELIKKIEDAYGLGLTEDEYQDIAISIAICVSRDQTNLVQRVTNTSNMSIKNTEDLYQPLLLVYL